jgi:hypothetical protein
VQPPDDQIVVLEDRDGAIARLSILYEIFS